MESQLTTRSHCHKKATLDRHGAGHSASISAGWRKLARNPKSSVDEPAPRVGSQARGRKYPVETDGHA
jgi:hypothetical protein